MIKKLFLYVCVLLVLVGCSEYQAVLKSTDPDYKYKKALEYFNIGQYVKSQTLLDDISSYYKGTERSQEILCYLARSYVGQKNYSIAADYYEAYIRNYPKGYYIIEARFQVAHCHYLEVPDARLDQQNTKKAIEYYNTFVELYPDNIYVGQAYEELEELKNKLAYKEFLSAKLYYNLGTYLGNNYLSAEIVAKNALRDYPGNKYNEDLAWIILQAKYQQLKYSVEERREDRTIETMDEYYNFMTEYPNSKYASKANRLIKDVKKHTDEKNDVPD